MIGMYGRCAFPRKCLNAGQSCVTEPVIRGSCVMKAIAVAMAIGFIAFLASPWVVQAQSTSATISGTVTDETGAVVQGAHILLTNEATSTEQTTMSGSAGNFTIIN